MKIRERLMECKIKRGLKSDYQLAEALCCPRQAISELMNGKRKPDAYIAVKIGEILKVHPLLLQAEFEAEMAKTEERKTFWLNFKLRIKTGLLGIMVLIFTAFLSPEPKAGDLVQHARNSFSHNWRLWRKWFCNLTKPTPENFYLGG